MQIGLKEMVAIAVPYLVAVAACFQFGYWGAFNVNVLELVSFADIAKLAVYPLLASLVFILAGVLVAEILQSPHLPSGGGANTNLGRFGRKHWRWLVAVQVLVIMALSLFGPDRVKWFLVAFLVASLSTPLSHVESLIELLPNPKWRATSLFILLLLPGFILLLLPGLGFAYGRQEAFLVKTGFPARVVDVTRSKLPLSSDTKNPVSYLEFVGGIHVLYEAQSGQVVFLKQRDETPLFITPRHR